MQIDDIIAKVDELTPNQYTREQKIDWLNQLDSKIDTELVQTHMQMPGEEPFNPYEDDIHVYYLQAMIAMQNAEIAKYNQQITMFNSAYSQYAALYNRTHFPKQPKGGSHLRF